MALRYHLDESVSPRILRPLRDRGVNTTSAADASLISASDEKHLAFSREYRRVVVAHDDDYLRLHSQGVKHCGIAYCHQAKYSVGELLRILLLLSACYESNEMDSRVEYLWTWIARPRDFIDDASAHATAYAPGATVAARRACHR